MKNLLRIVLVTASIAIPTVARADPPPPGCYYVLWTLICVDEPIGP
jgi:hypothetical protein